MSDAPFIKFFPSDFLGGVGGLSPAERGVYITLLCLIWDGDGPISMDDARLARRCGMPKAAFLKALGSLIDEGKIIRTVGGLTNDRAEKTLIDRQNRVQNATNAINSRWRAQEQKSEENQRKVDTDEIPEKYAADTKPEARSQIYGGDGSACAREAEILPDKTERETLLVAMGHDASGITANGRIVGNPSDMAERNRWSDLGLSHSQQIDVINEVMARKRDGPPLSFKYFTDAMRRRAADLTAPQLTPEFGGKNDQHGHRKSARGDAASDTALRAIAAAVRSRSAQGVDRG